MRVLILGGHGRMGPAVVEALGPHHELLVTDVVTPITDEHEPRQLDASRLAEVVAAAADPVGQAMEQSEKYVRQPLSSAFCRPC